jgi:hypothetical protein
VLSKGCDMGKARDFVLGTKVTKSDTSSCPGIKHAIFVLLGRKTSKAMDVEGIFRNWLADFREDNCKLFIS